MSPTPTFPQVAVLDMLHTYLRAMLSTGPTSVYRIFHSVSDQVLGSLWKSFLGHNDNHRFVFKEPTLGQTP